jgi:hypothetical protein
MNVLRTPLRRTGGAVFLQAALAPERRGGPSRSALVPTLVAAAAGALTGAAVLVTLATSTILVPFALAHACLRHARHLRRSP